MDDSSADAVHGAVHSIGTGQTFHSREDSGDGRRRHFGSLQWFVLWGMYVFFGVVIEEAWTPEYGRQACLLLEDVTRAFS